MDPVMCRIRAPSGAVNYLLEIRHFLWTHRSENETDLVIISGKECVKVHEAVILPISDHPIDVLPLSCPCTKPALCLPPFPSHILTAALEILYIGKASGLNSKEDLVKIKEVFSFLKVKGDIIADDLEGGNIGGEHDTGVAAGGVIVKMELTDAENNNSIIGQDDRQQDKGFIDIDSLRNTTETNKYSEEAFSSCDYRNEITGQFQNLDRQHSSSARYLDEFSNFLLLNRRSGSSITIPTGVPCLELNGDVDSNCITDKIVSPIYMRNNVEKVVNTTMSHDTDENWNDLNRTISTEGDNFRPIKEEPTSPYSQGPLGKLKPRKRKAKETDDAGIGLECQNILSVLKVKPGNEKSGKKSSEEKFYSCNQCEYKSKFNFNILKHIRQVHNNERQSFMCDLCSKMFTSKISLGNHKELVHERNEIICDDCGRSFFSKINLRRHKRNLHSVNPHKNKHNTVKHNTTPKQRRNASNSFSCDECDRKFPCKSKLNLHVQIQHRGILPHACDQCDKKYKFYVSLKNHKLVHSGIATFNCDHCTEKFISKRTLVRHLNDSHSIQTYKKYFRHRPKTLMCQICSKYFRGISELKRHEVVHTGERNHVCQICDKAFSQKKQMKEHINQHLAGNLDSSGFQINK